MPDEAIEELPADLLPMRPAGWERAWWLAVNYTLAALLAAAFAVPLLWIITASLRPAGLPPLTSFEWLPAVVSLEHYPYIVQVVEHVGFLANSWLVVAAVVPATVL